MKNKVLAALLMAVCISPAHATLTAYEPFNYPTASFASGTTSTATGIPTQTSGGGFVGNWTCGASPTIVSGLSYPSLPTAKNAMQSGSARQYVSFASPLPTTGTNNYVSFLFQSQTGNSGGNKNGVYFPNGGTGLWFGFGLNPVSNPQGYLGLAEMTTTGSSAQGSSGTLADSYLGNYGATYLVVLQFCYNSSGSTTNINCWINPLAGSSTPGAAATMSSTAFNVGTITGIGLNVQGAGSVTVDEIRVGTTYGDVAGYVPPASVPPAPAGVTASPGNAQVFLNWAAVAGATNYNVCVGLSSNVYFKTNYDLTTSTGCTNTGLTNGMTYWFAVQSVGTAGTSTNSQPSVGVTPEPARVSGNLGNIMPLGDQFTDGYPVVGGYRDPLYALTNAGATFAFVGSTNDNATAMLAAAGEQWHEGHPGYFIAGQAITGVPTPNGMAGLYENLRAWIGPGGVQPNIILLMIGANDIGYNYANGWTNAATRLLALINQIYYWQPRVTLYVGSVPPRSAGYGSWTAATLNGYIQAYNAAIPGLVGAERSLGRNIYFVDICGSITTNDLSADGVDPSAAGYQKIAGAWAGALASFSPPQTVYYVSPTGLDTNAGTIGQPFATLARAQSAVRTINTNMTGDIIIYLRGGTYALTNTLALAPADSGNNGHQVRYQAYAPETPVIYGGKTITGWTLHDAGKNIWQAGVAATDNFRQLYVNGVKAVRAYGAPPAGYAVITDAGYTTTDTNLQFYGNITNLEIVTHSVNWTQSRLPVAGIQNTNITIQQPCLGLAQNLLTSPTRMENAYEFLTSPGYWYLNLYTHTLYYIPRAGENLATATVEAPVVEQLITITGDSTNPVSNLSFVGLTFRLANWLQPSTGLGLASPQANQDDLTTSYLWVVKAALDCTGARNVGVTACTFANLGGDGVNFLRASQNDTIDGCVFTILPPARFRSPGAVYWTPPSRLVPATLFPISWSKDA